jgi:hypothetical protein
MKQIDPRPERSSGSAAVMAVVIANSVVGVVLMSVRSGDEGV